MPDIHIADYIVGMIIAKSAESLARGFVCREFANDSLHIWLARTGKAKTVFFKKNSKPTDPEPASGQSNLSFVESLPSEIECSGQTDIGQRRNVNQDQFLIADLHKNMHVQSSSQPTMDEQLFGQAMGKLLFVADGMGGARAGEVASEMAIQSMAQFLLNSMHWLYHPKQVEIEQFVADLKKGVMRCHQLIRQDANRDPSHRGMGTTLTVAYLLWPMLYVVHVGDSRCYILRDKSLQLLTKDQTLAQHLHDEGHLEGEAFGKSPYHHVLLSAIGADAEPDAIVYKTRLLTGDRILLCSDGVNAHLPDPEIEKILGSEKQAKDICQKLIDTANERGGKDNITAVVAVTR